MRMDKRFLKLRMIWLMAVIAFAATASAQIGKHRDDFAVGVNGGVMLSTVGFKPSVTQDQHVGITGGVSVRYVCEKYYTMICSVLAEFNYAQMGWKERILNTQDAPVINPLTGIAEEYSRNINYVQLPVFAHLAWGREVSGMNFFFQAGPQLGWYLGESTSTNFDVNQPYVEGRSNNIVKQYSMKVENSFDYGIAAGLGVEWSNPKMGHFLIEGRYYYGLGNIYGASKRDYFGISNHNGISIKFTYLFDLKTTKDADRR
jgi:hypothetical protein